MTAPITKADNDFSKLKLEDRRPVSDRFQVALSAVIFLLAAIGFAVYSNRNDDGHDHAMETMLRWLEANGVQMDGIEIVSDGFGGRDFQSSQPIREGETLAVMPRQMMFGRDVCQNDTAVQAVWELTPDISSTEKLAICLLANMKGTSFWAPFIDTLPKLIPLPIFWDEEDVLWLEVPHFIQHVLETKEALETTYEILKTFFPAASLDDYMHAWAVVASRAWGFDIEDGGMQEYLVPFFDMANHEPNGIMAGFDEDELSAKLVAPRDYDLGVPVHTFYSNHSNFMLLHSYGFTMENNDEHMTCMIDDGDQLWLLDRNLGEGSEFQQFMEKHRAASITEHNNFLDHEILALEKLFLALEAAQESSTTLEEDEELLKDESLTTNQRHALRARIHEKLCWKSFTDLAHTTTKTMYNPEHWTRVEAKFGDWKGFNVYEQHISTLFA